MNKMMIENSAAEISDSRYIFRDLGVICTSLQCNFKEISWTQFEHLLN